MFRAEVITLLIRRKGIFMITFFIDWPQKVLSSAQCTFLVKFKVSNWKCIYGFSFDVTLYTEIRCFYLSVVSNLVCELKLPLANAVNLTSIVRFN